MNRATTHSLLARAQALALALAFVFSSASRAEEPDGEKPAPEEAPPSITQHQVRIGDSLIAYTTEAGRLRLATETGEPKADVFYVAYTRNGIEDLGKRPLTFSFNGGPGSSSVWLHLGAFGPRIVKMTEDGFPLPPPYELETNAHSILDLTDLVFIDPVTTGYSRPAKDEDPSQFHGLEEDVEWVAEFIRLYTTRKERWSSPKYLAGESYGTTRAAALSLHLQRRHGMYLNGLILVSSILNFQTARFGPGNDLPYVLFLPTYTATAWYHQRLGPELLDDLEHTLKMARKFALEEYAPALLKGDQLSRQEELNLVNRLAHFTGLTPEAIRRMNLRIDIGRFVKELMRESRRTVGRLDSRFQGMDADAAGERYEFDPSYAAIQGPYTATLNHYLRSDLGVQIDLPYEILTGRVRPWSYASHENRFVNVAERMRQAMTQNPALKVFIANGYYDLATPFFATEYTVSHLGLEPELRGNVSMGYYESGHMMYIHRPSLVKLKQDIRGFLSD